jgi:hypothetical protein
MSAYKIQTPGNYPEESIQHSKQGESLKSRIPEITGRNMYDIFRPESWSPERYAIGDSHIRNTVDNLHAEKKISK